MNNINLNKGKIKLSTLILQKKAAQGIDLLANYYRLSNHVPFWTTYIISEKYKDLLINDIEAYVEYTTFAINELNIRFFEFATLSDYFNFQSKQQVSQYYDFLIKNNCTHSEVKNKISLFLEIENRVIFGEFLKTKIDANSE